MSSVLVVPDYEAEDVLVLREPRQLKLLANPVREHIVVLLRERAASTTELAAALSMPKGTVGHHVKALEGAGLIRVVRTRQVRAVTEKFYGRVARLFVPKGEEEIPENVGRALAAVLLRQASVEALDGLPEWDTSAFAHARLDAADSLRLRRRLERLLNDFLAADRSDGEPHALVISCFPSQRVLPPRGN
jgi:DNA-binding transcriptional ArsR family regulator